MSYEMEKPSVSGPSEALARLSAVRVATQPSTAVATPQTDAALKRLDAALDRLVDYVGAIGGAADFLCGPVPEGSAGAAADGAPAPGIVGRIDDRTARVSALLDLLQSHVERLGAL